MYYNKKMARVFSLVAAISFLLYLGMSILSFSQKDTANYTWDIFVLWGLIFALTILLFVAKKDIAYVVVIGGLTLLNLYWDIPDLFKYFSQYSVPVLLYDIAYVTLFVLLVISLKKKINENRYLIPAGIFFVSYLVDWIIKGSVVFSHFWPDTVEDVFFLLSVLFMCLWLKKEEAIGRGDAE